MTSHRCSCRNHIAVDLCGTRRRLLGWSLLGVAAGATGLLGLSGCSDAQDTSAVLPQDIARGTSCHLDGMLLADYPGPKAQLHHGGRGSPYFFCDTVELFNTLLAGEQVRAWRAAYVQDMGAADWESPQGHWIDAKGAFYVHGSSRHGSMGPTLASFGQQVQAQAFAREYGGKVLRFDQVTPEQVDLSGGAMHDMRM